MDREECYQLNKLKLILITVIHVMVLVIFIMCIKLILIDNDVIEFSWQKCEVCC